MKHPEKSDSAGGSPRPDPDETYKRHAVELTLRGDRSIRAVARELGLSEWTLHRWRKRYASRPPAAGGIAWPSTPQEKDEEIRRLRAEIFRLQERELILKKSLGILSETPGSGMPKSRR